MEVVVFASFHQPKWTTNWPELLHEDLDIEQLPVNVRLDEQQDLDKALGIQWRSKEDTFSFKVSLCLDNENSKRQLLSDSSWLESKFGSRNFGCAISCGMIASHQQSRDYKGKVQLYGFSDASEAAFSVVVYARGTNEEGSIIVNLPAAKTRVAPIKQSAQVGTRRCCPQSSCNLDRKQFQIL